MILGGGLVGRRVAELLGKSVDVKLIERDAGTCAELSDRLRHAEVLHGDGSDADVLAMAGILEMDIFIATTGSDETNIVSCLLAKHLMNRRNRDPKGSKGKTIAMVNRRITWFSRRRSVSTSRSTRRCWPAARSCVSSAGESCFPSPVFMAWRPR